MPFRRCLISIVPYLLPVGFDPNGERLIFLKKCVDTWRAGEVWAKIPFMCCIIRKNREDNLLLRFVFIAVF